MPSSDHSPPAPPVPLDPSAIKDYHAHVYYEPGVTEAAASELRDRLAAAFPAARLGRWHPVPVGPHTRAMYQVAFAVDLFPTLVPFLMLNRAGLTVLLHPGTGDDPRDHTSHAAWLGAELPLRMEAFTQGADADDQEPAAPAPGPLRPVGTTR